VCFTVTNSVVYCLTTRGFRDIMILKWKGGLKILKDPKMEEIRSLNSQKLHTQTEVTVVSAA
jgi:hypothetical protein